MVKRKEKDLLKQISKLSKGNISNKKVFKPSKLKVEVHIPKEPLLRQKNKFFTDTYNQEKENVLSWN